MRFDGKAVVVTGGALGIGRAACELLAERGASVAVLDWNEEAGRETADAISAGGGNAVFSQVDVADQAAVAAAVDQAAETFGAINGLIVSAGIQRYGTAVTTTDEQWDEVLNVNLRCRRWRASRTFSPIRSANTG